MNTSLNRIIAHKQADLVTLEDQEKQANDQVELRKAIVNTLKNTEEKFAKNVKSVDTDQTQALKLKTQASALLNQVRYLKQVVATAGHQTQQAQTAIVQVADHMARILNSLVAAIQVIQQLAAATKQQKTINQMVPSDLIQMIKKVETALPNVLNKTTSALEACYAAEGSGQEASALIQLEQTQVGNWETFIKYGCPDDKTYQGMPLNSAIQGFYIETRNKAQVVLQAQERVASELRMAQGDLVSAESHLQSVQAGLKAAKAASAV